jgi:hypothetical protein
MTMLARPDLVGIKIYSRIAVAGESVNDLLLMNDISSRESGNCVLTLAFADGGHVADGSLTDKLRPA